MDAIACGEASFADRAPAPDGDGSCVACSKDRMMGGDRSWLLRSGGEIWRGGTL